MVRNLLLSQILVSPNGEIVTHFHKRKETMSKKDLFHEEVEGRMEKLKQKPIKKKKRQQAKVLIKSSPLCLVW